MANEFVFVMEDLRKVVGEGRVILDGINLSFFPGAKIGVLGHNGAGKSSLLRIMAGVDDDFHGEARPASGILSVSISFRSRIDSPMNGAPCSNHLICPPKAETSTITPRSGKIPGKIKASGINS